MAPPTIFYGIDPGIRNLAITKLSIFDDKSFKIDYIHRIDLGKGPLRFNLFHKFASQNMLEEGVVFIEFQHRNGRSKDISYYIFGYLVAFFGQNKVRMHQSRLKFKVIEELNLMPEHEDLKIYENRKKTSITIMDNICKTLGHEMKDKSEKLDDMADSLLYALTALRKYSPSCLNCLSKEAEKMDIDIPKVVERIILPSI